MRYGRRPGQRLTAGLLCLFMLLSVGGTTSYAVADSSDILNGSDTSDGSDASNGSGTPETENVPEENDGSGASGKREENDSSGVSGKIEEPRGGLCVHHPVHTDACGYIEAEERLLLCLSCL